MRYRAYLVRSRGQKPVSDIDRFTSLFALIHGPVHLSCN